MKNQVLSIEQMQQLTEWGVDTSKASMSYYYDGDLQLGNKDEFYVPEGGNTKHPMVNTFTAFDLMELLPDEIKVGDCVMDRLEIMKLGSEWCIFYCLENSEDCVEMDVRNKCLLTALYDTVTELLGNNYNLKTKS